MTKWLRRLGIGVLGLVLLLAAGGGGIYGVTSRAFTRQYDIQPENVAIPSDTAAIARGRHLATAVGKCVDCHDQGLKGKVMIDDPVFGRLVTSNLTTGKGGVLGKYTNEQLVRAIRHGVKADGTAAIVMPSQEYYYFNDQDLGALIAYIRSLPPVDNELPPHDIKFLPRALYVAKQIDLLSAEVIEHNKRPPFVPAGVTREYGEYMAQTGGCFGCHGPGLSGGKMPGAPPDFPPATNITPTGIGNWTEAQFIQAMRTGMRPNGTPIDPFMPWSYVGQLSDDELKALWLFLRAVPAKESGLR